MRIYQENGHTNIAMSVAEAVDLSSKLLRATHGVVQAGMFYTVASFPTILEEQGKAYPSVVSLLVEHEKMPRVQKKPAKKKGSR